MASDESLPSRDIARILAQGFDPDRALRETLGTVTEIYGRGGLDKRERVGAIAAYLKDQANRYLGLLRQSMTGVGDVEHMELNIRTDLGLSANEAFDLNKFQEALTQGVRKAVGTIGGDLYIAGDVKQNFLTSKFDSKHRSMYAFATLLHSAADQITLEDAHYNTSDHGRVRVPAALLAINKVVPLDRAASEAFHREMLKIGQELWPKSAPKLEGSQVRFVLLDSNGTESIYYGRNHPRLVCFSKSWFNDTLTAEPFKQDILAYVVARRLATYLSEISPDSIPRGEDPEIELERMALTWVHSRGFKTAVIHEFLALNGRIADQKAATFAPTPERVSLMLEFARDQGKQSVTPYALPMERLAKIVDGLK